MASIPQIGLWRRSLELMHSFARAIGKRESRRGVLDVQRDYRKEPGLKFVHKRQLERLVAQRLRELEKDG